MIEARYFWIPRLYLRSGAIISGPVSSAKRARFADPLRRGHVCNRDDQQDEPQDEVNNISKCTAQPWDGLKQDCESGNHSHRSIYPIDAVIIAQTQSEIVRAGWRCVQIRGQYRQPEHCEKTVAAGALQEIDARQVEEGA